MNRRQKKKWNKNHVTLIDRRTGKKSTCKLEHFIALCKIAEITPEELAYMCRDTDASG